MLPPLQPPCGFHPQSLGVSILGTIKSAILKDYPTIENFCFIHDLPKATIFRFLSEDDCNFTANTLLKVVKALEKSLDIKLK